MQEPIELYAADRDAAAILRTILASLWDRPDLPPDFNRRLPRVDIEMIESLLSLNLAALIH